MIANRSILLILLTKTESGHVITWVVFTWFCFPAARFLPLPQGAQIMLCVYVCLGVFFQMCLSWTPVLPSNPELWHAKIKNTPHEEKWIIQDWTVIILRGIVECKAHQVTSKFPPHKLHIWQDLDFMVHMEYGL